MTHIVGARLRNWMCFRGEHELALVPGCYAINAELDGDRRRSNYLGKSSFLAALRWVFDNDKVEDVDTLDELISWRETDMMVDIELSDGTFISRGRKRGRSGSLVVEENGRELLDAEAQAAIDRIIGLSSDDRLTTNWSEQGDLAVMVKKSTTPKTLTDMIERWLDLGRLAEAGKIVFKALDSYAGEHAAALAELAELEERADPTKIEALEERLVVLTREHAQRVAEADKVRTKREQHAERRLLADRIDELVEVSRAIKFDKIEMPAPHPDDAAPPIDEPAVEKLRLIAYEKTSTAEREKKRLVRLVEGEFDGACPVSKGFACPAKADINARTEPNRKALKEAERNYAAAKLEHDGHEKKLTAARARNERAAKRERAEARETERVRGLTERQDKLQKLIAEAKASGVTPLREGETPPPVAPAPDTTELDQVRAELADRRSASGLVQEARQTAVAAGAKARAHRLAASILGPEGARRRAADGAVRHIESEANRKLAEAGVGLTVKAAWGRDTGVLADQCPDCGWGYPKSQAVKRCERCGVPRGLKVKHEFRWKPSRTSGAARDLVGLALRVSAFEWLSAVRGAALSVAVLDEVTGQLDVAHRASVSASIRRLLAGTFEQAFLTAHESGVLAACDRRLLITSDGDWSTIKVAS
jgi:hypothetical protein